MVYRSTVRTGMCTLSGHILVMGKEKSPELAVHVANSGLRLP